MCETKAKLNSSIMHPAAFLGNPAVAPPVHDAAAKLEELCQFIFKHGDDRSRTRALLCSVYHHALHDRYYVARDKLLMSHIQDNIDKVDTKTMILYNRALVTIGLSAFREGLVQKVRLAPSLYIATSHLHSSTQTPHPPIT
jgi:translation initiation factor 3 subunit C